MGRSQYRERIFRELRFEFLKKVVLETVLDTGIVFLFTYLILSLTRIPWLMQPIQWHNLPVAPRFVISLVAALMFFVFDLRRRRDLFSLELFGSRDQSVVEMLKTASDNLEEDNMVVRQLFQDLGEKLGEVSAGDTFSLRQISMRFISLSILAGLVVVSGVFTYTVSPPDIDIPQGLPGSGTDEDTTTGGRNVSLDRNASIYGEKTPVNTEGEELGVNLSTGNGAAPGEDGEKRFNQFSYPTQVDPVGAGGAQEEELEDFALAQQYSLRIRNQDDG